MKNTCRVKVYSKREQRKTIRKKHQSVRIELSHFRRIPFRERRQQSLNRIYASLL